MSAEAGLAIGFWSSSDKLKQAWCGGGLFEPHWSAAQRDANFHKWQKVIAAARAGVPRGVPLTGCRETLPSGR